MRTCAARAIERVQAHIPLAGRLDVLIIIGLLRGIVRPGVDFGQARAGGRPRRCVWLL